MCKKVLCISNCSLDLLLVLNIVSIPGIVNVCVHASPICYPQWWYSEHPFYIWNTDKGSSVGGVTVSMVAFQAVDPGSTPGRRTHAFEKDKFSICMDIWYSLKWAWYCLLACSCFQRCNILVDRSIKYYNRYLTMLLSIRLDEYLNYSQLETVHHNVHMR